eukprot:15469793-Alexandrium_andersonii.AAC.1
MWLRAPSERSCRRCGASVQGSLRPRAKEGAGQVGLSCVANCTRPFGQTQFKRRLARGRSF